MHVVGLRLVTYYVKSILCDPIVSVGPTFILITGMENTTDFRNNRGFPKTNATDDNNKNGKLHHSVFIANDINILMTDNMSVTKIS